MPDINNINTADIRRSATPAARTRETASPSPEGVNTSKLTLRRPDEFQLSAAAQRAAENALADTPPTENRAARLDALRADIASGDYPADANLDTALDRLIDDFRSWTRPF